MSPLFDRRRFLQSSAALVGAAAITPALWAAKPVKRNGRAMFKFSLAAYSYRKLLSGEKPEMTLEDFIADCAAMGLDGTELTSYYFPPRPSAEFLNRLKHAAFRLGLDVSGTAIRNDFCHPPGEQRTKELNHVKQWVDYAQSLGAPVIRVFSGRPRGGQSFEAAYKLAVEGMQECCDYAGKRGVFLALENHGGLSTKIDDLLRLVKDVKSDWFGVNLDTGNFQGSASAEQAYAEMAMMAPYALNVQVKVMIALAGRKKVESDFTRLARILSEAAYRGYVVLEYEESEDARKASPKFVDQLRAAFARVAGAPPVPQSTFRGTYPVNAVCTTGIVADLVKNIGGERVRVSQLMNEGVDAHAYQPTRSDGERLARADVVFYSGLSLEGGMSGTFSHVRRSGTPVFAASEVIDDSHLLRVGDEIVDPHVWHNASLWSQVAAGVAQQLSSFDPKHAKEYDSNLEDYQRELTSLHAYAQSKLAQIPEERRVLVTCYDTLGYFGRAHGWKVKSMDLGPGVEPSVKHIDGLVDYIVTNKVKAVFPRPDAPLRIVTDIIHGCQARKHRVAVGPPLLTDTLGKKGTPTGAYAGMMRHNVDEIVKALK